MIPVILLLTVLCSTLSQLCQKQATRAAEALLWKRLLWLGLAIGWMGGAFVLWVKVLRITPLTIAYPLLSLNVVLVTVAARLVWLEPISRRQWWGIGCIMLGIFLLGSQL